eukprot:5385854-Pyramimonas_sp.AAC.1
MTYSARWCRRPASRWTTASPTRSDWPPSRNIPLIFPVLSCDWRGLPSSSAVRATGAGSIGTPSRMFPLPSRDWLAVRAYSPLPDGIGSLSGHIPPALMGSARCPGIFPPL